MRLNFTAIFGRINWENAPTTFFFKFAGRELPNASELHGKQLHFWMHKSGKCAQNFLYKA